jgi:hypothetical protein
MLASSEMAIAWSHCNGCTPWTVPPCAGVHAEVCASTVQHGCAAWLLLLEVCSTDTTCCAPTPGRFMLLGDVFAVSVPSASGLAASGPFSSAADSARPGSSGPSDGAATIYFRVVDLQPPAPACLLIDPLTTQVALQVGALAAAGSVKQCQLVPGRQTH